MTLEIKLFEPPFSDEFVKEFIALTQKIFDRNADEAWLGSLKWRLENMPDLCVLVAQIDGQMVGYKAGYATAYDRYYSWLGGVHPDYRRQGIARDLMNSQHNWLKSSRFNLIETHMAQNNKNMIELNQKCGLIITGMFMNDEKPYFIMRKKIEK
jgi:ribosomal protein S18 acetylase RimI-like enzyme